MCSNSEFRRHAMLFALLTPSLDTTEVSVIDRQLIVGNYENGIGNGTIRKNVSRSFLCIYISI